MKKIKCTVCGEKKDAYFDFTSIENLSDFPVVMCNDCFEKGQREQDAEYPEDEEE